MYKIYIYKGEVMTRYAPVDMPKRTVTVSNKSGTYVYLTQKVEYSSELKRSFPKRIAIGKLNEDGRLIPNKNYYSIYGEKVELIDQTDRSDYVSVGPQMVVENVSKNVQLSELLEDIFGEDGNKMLDIATYMIMRETNAMQYFEDYGYGHSLFNIENFTDTTAGRLLESMKVKDIDLFISSWVKMHTKKEIYVAYDSTNMNCVAGNLELAEYGHAKDDPELPQVNVSLGYDQTDNVPLMYELYPGSIIDNTECGKMVDRAKHYGCKNIGFILDRGYFSLENIRYFERNGYDYILMTKGNARFVQESVEECGAVLRNGTGNYIEGYELYGMTVEKRMFGDKKKQYVHVYYNGVQAEKEKIAIHNRLNGMDAALNGKVDSKAQRREDVKSYENLYRIRYDDNGYVLSYQRKDKKVKELLEKTGYFVIVTSKKMSAEEALMVYRDRDAVEKVFRMEKSYLGCDAFRVHSGERLESKVFISFIALIIRNEIYQRLKPLYKKNRKEYTVPKALQQLERLGITKLSDERYHQRYTLTKRQKEILGAFEISGKQYTEYCKKIESQMNGI